MNQLKFRLEAILQLLKNKLHLNQINPSFSENISENLSENNTFYLRLITKLSRLLFYFNQKLTPFWLKHKQKIQTYFKRTFVFCLIVYVVQIIVIACIDPNQYKSYIEEYVAKETGMGLVLKGPLELSGIKGIVLQASDLVLKQKPNSRYEMVKIESVKIAPRFLYLITGRMGFKLTITNLHYRNYKIQDIRTKIAIRPKKISFSKINIGLRKGKEEGRLKVDLLNIDLNADDPQYYLRHHGKDFPLTLLISNFNLEPFMKGKSILDMELHLQGKTLEMMKKTVTGKLEFEIKKGSFIGMDLIDSLKQARSLLTTLESKLTHTLTDVFDTLAHRKHQTPVTPFSLLKMKATIEKGKLKTEEFFVKHSQYHLIGQGSLNLMNQSIACKVHAYYRGKENFGKPKEKTKLKTKGKGKAKTSKKNNHVPLIIHISGPIEKPDVKPDFHSYLQYIKQS